MLPNTVPTPTPEQIEQARGSALNATHPESWVWDETAVSWVAPVAPPSDGFPYLWDEPTTSWVPFPEYPRS
jgi:hypothetical protein